MLPIIWAAFLPTPIFPFILSHQLLPPGPALKPLPPAASSPHPRRSWWQLRASWWCPDPGKGRDVGKPCLLQLTPPVLRAPSPPAPGHALSTTASDCHRLNPCIPGPAGCKAQTCCSVTFTHSVIHEAPATPLSHPPHTPLFLCSFCGTHLPTPRRAQGRCMASLCVSGCPRLRVSRDSPHRAKHGLGGRRVQRKIT